jgi:tripartite ATP-independent transporter DctM subunit
MPGGLAIVCLVASAFFTTFTGGSGITIVAIGGLLYPALMSERYPERFSLGLVTTGGSLGLLFPPSVPIVLYGVVAGVMIEKLFAAGIIPGIVVVLAIGIYAVAIGAKTKIPKTPFQLKAALQAFWVAKWEVMLPVALIFSMAKGWLRIHEAAAFTAVYVLVVEVWIYRDVSFRYDVPRVIRESMTLVGAILAILATAIGFTAFLIQAGVPTKIFEAMETLITSKVMFLFVLNIFLLVVGMLMDIFSAIVVVVPLIIPVAMRFGVDPYHLGIVFLLNLEIGYLTPPVGLNLFIASFRFGKPITTLYRSVLPYIGLLLVALGVTTYLPILSTWLPDMLNMQGGDTQMPVDDQQLDPLPGEAPLDLDDLPSLDDLDSLGDEPLDLDSLEGGSDDAPLDLDSLEGAGADGPGALEGGSDDEEPAPPAR